MADPKPTSTSELVSTAASLAKAALVVLVMTLLEWSRLKEKVAKVDAAKTKNDLEIQKLKTEAASDERDDKTVLDDFLASRGLGASTDRPGGPAEG